MGSDLDADRHIAVPPALVVVVALVKPAACYDYYQYKNKLTDL